MNHDFRSNYPTDEFELYDKIQDLHEKWKQTIGKTARITFRSKKEEERKQEFPALDYYCKDGFFPYYTYQKSKVLIIGRETRAMNEIDSEFNYIKSLFYTLNTPELAQKQLNTSQSNGAGFLRKCLNVVNYIQGEKNLPSNYIELGNLIGSSFARENDLSYAFMELSKYCDDSFDEKDSANVDINLVEKFITHSNLPESGLFIEEIRLLNPDVILTMNLWPDNLAKLGDLSSMAFGPDENWKSQSPSYSNEGTKKYELLIQEKEIPVFDTYHFSSRKKLQPVYEALDKCLQPVCLLT